jgi:hypothetical protein
MHKPLLQLLGATHKPLIFTRTCLLLGIGCAIADVFSTWSVHMLTNGKGALAAFAQLLLPGLYFAFAGALIAVRMVRSEAKQLTTAAVPLVPQLAGRFAKQLLRAIVSIAVLVCGVAAAITTGVDMVFAGQYKWEYLWDWILVTMQMSNVAVLAMVSTIIIIRFTYNANISVVTSAVILALLFWRLIRICIINMTRAPARWLVHEYGWKASQLLTAATIIESGACLLIGLLTLYLMRRQLYIAYPDDLRS